MTNLTAANIAGSGGQREVHDFYATPEADVHKFLDITEAVPNGCLVLEPSAGLGHMVRPIREKRPQCGVIAGDLVQREFPLDYVNDFLALDTTALSELNIGCIITNPPFKHAQAFIEKPLDCCDGDVIMLLKLAFLEGKGRQSLFERNHLREVWVSRSRINCMKPSDMAVVECGGKPPSSTIAMAWYIFNRNHTGAATINWL